MQEYWWLDDYGIPTLHSQGFTGKGIKIAVLDTGVCLTHPALKLDKNLLHDVTGSPSGTEDIDGHGTHCIGTINSTSDGNGNLLGIAPDAEIYVCKVTHDIVRDNSYYLKTAIEWAIQQNVDVISISQGFPSNDSDLEQAVKVGIDHGILFICAAGNKPNGFRCDHIYYPAHYNSVISVGAIDQNRMPIASSILTGETTIFAPGDNILSTYINNGYARLTGSSQATPFVAALCALFVEEQRRVNPTYKALQLSPMLLKETDSFQYGKIIAPLKILKTIKP
ncbi:MAG TPA: S8 family serine peptidase [Williamwhitmania sp.]|nr:S8 family serine peptidase [Williamwhitmania sp.]